MLGQYSKFVRPGAVRYAVANSPSGLQTLAFWRNGTWTVVATNTNTSATTLVLDLGSGTLTPTGTHRTSASENLASVANPSVSGSTITTSLPARSMTTFVLSSPGQPGSSTGSPSGSLTGVQSGRCLDVPGGSVTNCTQLAIWDCHGGSNQQFTFNAYGTINVYGGSSLKCLDGYQARTSPGTIVDIYTCNGGANQKWTLG